MHPKVVLVVSRSHWRCVSCRVHHKRTVSIDQHLQSAHPHLAVPSSHAPAGCSGDTCCHSDGELDTTFPTKDILPLKTLSFETEGNQLLEKECQAQKLAGTESARQSCRRQKRTSTRKTASVQTSKSSQKPEKEDTIATNRHLSRFTSRDLDEDCQSLDENVGCDEHVATAEEKTDKKMTQRKLQPVPKRKCAGSQIKHCVNNRRQKGSRKPSTAKAALKDQNNVSMANGAAKKLTKRTGRLCTKAEKDCNDPESVGVKEVVQGNSEIETPDAFEEGECAKPCKYNSKKLKQIDKSKIATSCVPWLLDSGRKAGEKVTKKTRRTLTPEEKQAVRELYGIHLYGQAAETCTQNLVVPGETGGQYDAESQSMNVDENCISHQSSLASVQRINQEEDATSLHRHCLVNMFSQGTRDFYMDGPHAHDDVYPSYGCTYSQQQQQQRHTLYSSQALDFYSPHHNIPSQRSNLMNFQPYTQQAAPPVLSTPNVGDSSRPQMQVTAPYSQQGGNVATLSHPHAVPAPAVCPPLPAPATAPSVATSTYEVNADTMVNGPHSAIPPAASGDIKSDPTSLQGAHTEGSVPHNVPQGTIDVGENPHNHCSVCKQTFESASEFEKHRSGAAGFGSVECKRCRSVFHGLHELNLHVFCLHETEKQGFCFTCNEDIAGMENLERHAHRHAYDCERRQVEMRFHDCRLCGEELPSCYRTLRTHYYQHHVAHVCSECFQYFTDLKAYKEHSTTHSGKLFVCSICGTKFESVEDFDGHAPCSEDTWAEDGKGDQCGKCGLWCPNRAVVEAHRKQHRSQGDVQAYRQGAKAGFPCASCEKVFKNKHACRRHVKMVHQGVSCYKHYCEYCGKGFLTKGHMRDHIALHHLKIKRYSCDYCSRQFVCAPTLRRHVRKEHTKHRPYQCQHCGERFFEKTPLQRHLTQHTGLAPFMCEHCGKGFYTKHSFTNHASTHSSVKDFVCTGCQKGFTRKYNLQAHVKICKML